MSPADSSTSDAADDILPGMLYVKVRDLHATRSPAEIVRAAAARAGLHVEDASSFGALNVPLSSSVLAYGSRQSSERQRAIERAESELRRIVVVRYRDEIEPRLAAAMMADEDELEYAEPVRVPTILGTPSEPNDPKLGEQSNLAFVRALDAWKIWAGDTSTVIGIVDAGFTIAHEDLRDNVAPNYGESGLDGSGNDRATNGVDDDDNGVVDDYRGANLTTDVDGTVPGEVLGSEHGTQVTGIASATTDNGIGIAGIGNRCRFFPVKAAPRNDPQRRLVASYEGVLYCARRGFKVINCSWGSGGYSQTEQDIVRLVTLAYDAAIVAGAGNFARHEKIYPAAYRYTLGVTAVYENGVYPVTWGEHLDVSATSGMSTSQTTEYLGLAPVSSYTTPLVAGAVALVRSRWPELSAMQSLAHVRLTSVPLPPFDNPAQVGLVGYGRLDALNAVSVEPFSHPGMVVDSAWLTDIDGNRKESFGIGEIGFLNLAITNLLGPASGVSLRVRHYTADSLSVRFDTASITIGNVGTMEMAPVVAVPFEVIGPAPGATRFRIEITGEDYNDFHYETADIYRPYTVYEAGDVRFTLTNDARFGFDYRDFGPVGEGVAVGGLSQLWEGGVIVAASQERRVDNLHSDGENMIQLEDFEMVESPSADNGYTLTVRDDNASDDRRIGLEIEIQLRSAETIDRAIGLELRVRNVSDATIDSLRVGYFFDWDIDGDEDGQTLQHVPEPGVPGVGLLGLASRPTMTQIATAIAGEVPHPIFYAIDVEGDPTRIDDDFNEFEKFRVMSNGLGRPQAGPGDIAEVIGQTFVNVPPGGQRTMLLAIGFGSSGDAEAIESVADLIAALPTGIPSEHSRTSSGISLGGSIVRDELRVQIDGDLLSGATLEIIDALGRPVYASSTLGSRGTSTIRVDCERLPPGLYLLRVHGAEGQAARPFMVVR